MQALGIISSCGFAIVDQLPDFYVFSHRFQPKIGKIPKTEENRDMEYSFHVFVIAGRHVSFIYFSLCFRALGKKQNQGLLDHRCLSVGSEI